MRDYEIRVARVDVDRNCAEIDAREASDDEHGDEARCEQHGRFEVDAPLPERREPVEDLIPVGTAISIVVTIIGIRSQGDIPETNMWCAQIENSRMRMAISERAISR